VRLHKNQQTGPQKHPDEAGTRQTKLWQIITRRKRKVAHIKPVMPAHAPSKNPSSRSRSSATLVETVAWRAELSVVYSE
jgi:hypothetical protein